MFVNIFSGIYDWIGQLKSLLFYRYSHLTPDDYTIMLVACICIGYLLLRGRN